MKSNIQKTLFVSMSRLNKIIAVKSVGQPECLAGLSDIGSNLPCLTTWVGLVLLRPAEDVLVTINHTLKPILEPRSQPAGRLGAFLDTHTFKRNPSGHPNIFCLKLIIEFYHHLIIPQTLFNDIMPYFDEFIHIYG